MTELEEMSFKLYPIIKDSNNRDANLKERVAFVIGAGWGQKRTMDQTREILGNNPFDIPKRE